MRLGVLIPSFSSEPTEAISAARVVEQAGLDGVFCYDHLWPIGEPGRPALSPYPLLGTLSQTTEKVCLGTLASRVGLVPDAVLVSQLLTIDEMSKGRLIATLGTGDQKSAAENLAYGVEFAPASVRRRAMRDVATALVGRGVSVWIGAGGPATNAVASEEGLTLNLWSAPVEQVAVLASSCAVSWAGRLPTSTKEAAAHLSSLAEVGATWAVCIWPGKLEPIVAAARAAGLES